MAMPTSAPVIAPIFAVTNEITSTTTPMIDNTTATDQAQLFALNRPFGLNYGEENGRAEVASP